MTGLDEQIHLQMVGVDAADKKRMRCNGWRKGMIANCGAIVLLKYVIESLKILDRRKRDGHRQ